MLDIRLYMLQRITALIMAPLTLGHIAVMIYAIQGGLSAAEILGRTQGSFWWMLFYGSFVIAVAIHAPIGLRTIMREVTSLSLPIINAVVIFMALFLCVAGSRAIFGLYGIAG